MHWVMVITIANQQGQLDGKHVFAANLCLEILHPHRVRLHIKYEKGHVLRTCCDHSVAALPDSCDSGPVFRNSTIPSIEDLLPFIFQLPPTKNFLSRAAMTVRSASLPSCQDYKMTSTFTFVLEVYIYNIVVATPLACTMAPSPSSTHARIVV